MEAWARWLPGWLDRRLPQPALVAPVTAPPTGEPSTEDASTGTTVVHGFVRTEEGMPVADAVLTLVAPSGTRLDRVGTLADGSYILSAPIGGSYLLAATARAYEPWSRRITVGRDPLVHDLTLSPQEAASPSHLA
ncbi:carboxypeptidase-like regulatory domain-containing protein [Streptomyces niveus]|uniref:carboxypeptidase-like regulatory domain-containing protein n=1 Tax=Streptomyces niveus TaxID=193462 RepID=UPI00084BED9E|nr:carboxypeptidase-like regulatory domain-containing protein [Streptomyces niveus]